MPLGDLAGSKTLETFEKTTLPEINKNLAALEKELARDIDRLLEKHIDAVHSKVQSLVRSDIDYAIANLRKETELVVADVHHRIQSVVRSDIDYTISKLRLEAELLVNESVTRMETAISKIRVEVAQDTAHLSHRFFGPALLLGTVVGIANIAGMAFAVWMMKP